MIGIISINVFGRLIEDTTDISTSWLPSIDTAKEMDTTISNIRLNELGYLTAISSQGEKSSLEYLEKEKNEMSSLLEKYGGLIFVLLYFAFVITRNIKLPIFEIKSAAASEELSSQSQLMKNLVGRFRLKQGLRP